MPGWLVRGWPAECCRFTGHAVNTSLYARARHPCRARSREPAALRRQRTLCRTQGNSKQYIKQGGGYAEPWCHPNPAADFLVLEGGWRDGTVRGHGWPRRAYRDVFTACPVPPISLQGPHQTPQYGSATNIATRR